MRRACTVHLNLPLSSITAAVQMRGFLLLLWPPTSTLVIAHACNMR